MLANRPDPGIVSGGDLVHTVFHHGRGEGPELDETITVHTGVWGLACTVAISELTDNLIGKLMAQIDTGEGNR